jgi:hypothetical protein
MNRQADRQVQEEDEKRQADRQVQEVDEKASKLTDRSGKRMKRQANRQGSGRG